MEDKSSEMFLRMGLATAMNAKLPKFVKWVGGKGQLLEQFKPLFPKKFNRYLEPFVGSGAVFFYVMQRFKPKETIISDINEELTTTYIMVRDNVEKLILELKTHKLHHMNEGKDYYLRIRSMNPKTLSLIARAARFIYLNKTCFNGLYRVNSKGQFNVPMGSYKNPNIVQEDKLRIISKTLKDVDIRVMSFEAVADLAEANDFIYFDPPYYPLKNSKSFTSYTKDNFLGEQQKLLAEVFKELDDRGCYVMLSNSDTQYIKDLYAGYNIHYVKATRLINSDASKRGKINELVITNY